MLVLYNACYQEWTKEQIDYMEEKGAKFAILDRNLNVIKEVNKDGKT